MGDRNEDTKPVSIAERARLQLECSEEEFALLFGDMVSTVVMDECKERLSSGKSWGVCVLIMADPDWAALQLVDAQIALVKAEPVTTGQQQRLCALVSLKQKFVVNRGRKVS